MVRARRQAAALLNTGGQTLTNNESQTPGTPRPDGSNQPYNHNSRPDGGPDYGSYYSEPASKPNRAPKKSDQPKNSFATASLSFGIMGMLNLCCYSFTTAILMGVCSVTLAYLSKNNQPMARSAVWGAVIGTLTVLAGIAEYFYALWISDMMKDPQFIPLFNEILDQVMQQMQQFSQQAP